MSVTFHLYKPLSNVKYLGSNFDTFTNTEINNKDKIVCGDGYTDEDFIEHWSDGKEHNYIDIAYYNAIAYRGKKVCRSWRRNKKRLNSLELQIFQTKRSWTYKLIPVEEIEYSQGWFLNKRFFKKEHTVVFCVTKKQMLNFFKQYVECNHKTDLRGADMIQRFIDSWEDGMIFKAAW